MLDGQGRKAVTDEHRISEGARSRLADTAGGGLGIDGSTPGSAGYVDERGTDGGVADDWSRGCQVEIQQSGDCAAENSAGREAVLPRASGVPGNFWSSFDIIPCWDGKARRIPQFESVLFSMVDGVSGGLDALRDSCGGQTEAEKEIIMDALKGFPLAGKVPGRVMLLKGSGNAIVPELAAEFIRAFMETL